MNTKRFLLIAVLTVLSASAFALIVKSNTTSVKADVQASESVPVLVNEPAVRMESGAIQFSDENVPDFRQHVLPFPKPHSIAGCMSDETATPRRYGGCIQ